MATRRRLLVTLLLSSLAHVGLLVDIPWRDWWDTLTLPEDEVLARDDAAAVERVQLATDTAAVDAGPPSLHYYRPAPPPPPPRPTRAPAALATEDRPATSPAPPAPAADAAAPPPSDGYEPPPTFPISVQAVHHARYRGISLRLHQTWFMEGQDYFVRNEARKFGFTALITSEGRLSPAGLTPVRFQLLLNQELQHFADQDHRQGLMTHGRAGRSRQSPIPPAGMQDMASLPFHVAVTYEGREERSLMVTTGSSIYRVILRPVASERLRLPGGEIDTIHLQGVRQREDGSEQSGYDIWLAPSLRNYPVRFSGPDSRGHRLDMSVLRMDFDGRRVFGDDSLEDTFEEHTPDALPDAVLDELDFQLPAE